MNHELTYALGNSCCVLPQSLPPPHWPHDLMPDPSDISILSAMVVAAILTMGLEGH